MRMSDDLTPTLEEAKRYIDAIDFTEILNKMVKREGWLRSDALQVCAQYRNYLYLRRKYKNQHKLPPTEEVDTMWHNHILDTKKYRKDCVAIFGEYHDHYPYFGFDKFTNKDDLREAFEITQKLYSEEFNGKQLYKVRNIYSTIASFIKMRLNK